MQSRIKRILCNTAVMMGILIVTVLLAELLRRTRMDDQIILLLYLLSVLVISRITTAYAYGLVASVLSTLAFDYFITDPRFGFSFSYTIGSPFTLLTMFAVTIITSALTNQMRAHMQTATEREHRAQLLYEINQKLLLTGERSNVVMLANEYLVQHLGRPVIFYTGDPMADESAYAEWPGATEAFHTAEERKRVHRLFAHGPDEFKRPKTDEENGIYYIPLVSKNERVLGVIGIAQGEDGLSAGDMTFVRMLTGQVTLALELQSMDEEQHSILVDAEREKMRSTLLRAISHDLRTPLTSILGASSTILEQKALAGAPEYEKMVMDIRDNTQWLIRMVENLLVITRISGDNVKITKTMEAAEEVVAGAVNIVRQRFPEYYIHVHAPEELLMVPMDATLVSQVIINLLENAVKNSPPESLILLDLERKGGYARFEVSDNGKGIPEHLLDNLFDVHSPSTEEAVDAARGVGIGLSICKTIIQAHGGSIEGYNREKGGANFAILLPLAGEAEEKADA